MLTFTTRVEDTVVGFVCIFCPIVPGLCDFGVLTFATWIEDAVISFIDILSAILLRFRYFRMLTLPARIQDAVVGLVSIFRVLSPIKSPYSLEFEAVVADASRRENTNLNMCLRKFKT